MKLKSKIALTAALAVGAVGLVAAPASAAGHCDSGYSNCYKFWEEWAGSQHHGKVQIKASVNDGGRHSKQGYIRFIRNAGPAIDTGRMYTSTASSSSDTTVRTRQEWVWDSPLWGDEYTTYSYYGFIWW